MYLIFDTETTGLPKDDSAPVSDVDNWPRCVQIAWQLHDEKGSLVEHKDYIIRPDGYTIPYESRKIHGISQALAEERGHDLTEVLEEFNAVLDKTDFIVGHNLNFDINVMGAEYYRKGIETKLADIPVLDTCTVSTAEYCKIGKPGKYKLPTLTELYTKLFGEDFKEAHNATADVEATARAFLELIRQGVFTPEELKQPPSYIDEFGHLHPETIKPVGIRHMNMKEESALLEQEEGDELPVDVHPELAEAPFAHLHNHTQHTILEATSEIGALVDKALEYEMPAIALTDEGNMMGAFAFFKKVFSVNNPGMDLDKTLEKDAVVKWDKMKPIIGCELHMVDDMLKKDPKERSAKVVLLARNLQGYNNLMKLTSIAQLEGFYFVPRIDKKTLLEYKDHLIVLSGGLDGVISHKILAYHEQEGEKELLWWKEHFGDDFYLEIVRHGYEEDGFVNKALINMARRHGVKLVATNNTFYVNQQDAVAQHTLIKVKSEQFRARRLRGEDLNDSKYFKSPEEMKRMFADIPDAILNITEIIDKTEPYILKRKVSLPKFEIPEEFKNPEDEKDGGTRGEQAYLRHLTYEGAKERWGEITDEIRERLEFELEVINTSHFAGYFLIVWDLIAHARKMGVSVGPGRGSAAGSAVAYCLKITNMDPIKYGLLFERFLNLERVTLPDIDIDFDDERRNLVFDYVIEKYGQENIAQIVTCGTMGPKSAFRDTARTMGVPPQEVNELSKMIPPKVGLADLLDREKWEAVKNNSDLRDDDKEKGDKFIQTIENNELYRRVVEKAVMVQGSVRNTGVHACGFIISPQPVNEIIPLARAKDSTIPVTQYDQNHVEDAGLLKMDFLGLKTLTLIRKTLEMVKAIHKVDIDIDAISLEDPKAMELFQQGNTIGVFQFESDGISSALRLIKPSKFTDIIAVVALYRPGPMEYIPLYADRKHGRVPTEYTLPDMQDILEETYGITIYQEQVMLLSQKLAGFSKAQADKLRKGMAKKKIKILEELKPLFFKNAMEKGHPKDKLEQIWEDWVKFSSYAFNKSHATVYAYVAFQTAYLKAYYPSEFMAATLTINIKDISKVSFYMEASRQLGIEVLGPDVNESYHQFSVNKKGEIRFGIGGIKGVGEGAAMSIIEERKQNGEYTSIYDFVRRIHSRKVNKRVMEGLVLAGAFDVFGIPRESYFVTDDRDKSFIDKLLYYGNRYKEEQESSQMSLFQDTGGQVELEEPAAPVAQKEWSILEKMSREKEVVGMYMTAHPLDPFRFEIEKFCNVKISEFQDMNKLLGRELKFAGIVTQVQHLTSRNNNMYGRFTIEDETGKHSFNIFGNTYIKYKEFLQVNYFLYIRMVINPKSYGRNYDERFYEISSLHELLDEKTKGITLFFEIEDLNEKLINELWEMSKKFKGKKNLYFQVHDKEEAVSVKLTGKKRKIHIDSNLIEYLTEKNWKFKLN